MKGKRIKACLICNPFAGKIKNNLKVIELIISYFKNEAYEINKMLTNGPLTAMEIAKEEAKKATDVIVVLGGDGTINEVANGIYGSESALMIIPMGTANLLAHHIKLPTKIQSALKAYKNSDVIKINIGKANERFFLLMVGVGFDGHIISKITPSIKLKYGKLAYTYYSIKESFLYQYPLFSVKINNKEISSSFAVISLSKEYAGLFSLTPDANITKNYFQICLFHRRGALSFWKYFLFALIQKHNKLSDVTLTLSDNLEIYSNEALDIWSQIDGELFSKLPLTISLATEKINLIVPLSTKMYFQQLKN